MVNGRLISRRVLGESLALSNAWRSIGRVPQNLRQAGCFRSFPRKKESSQEPRHRDKSTGSPLSRGRAEGGSVCLNLPQALRS
jgi:hypothetical protein